MPSSAARKSPRVPACSGRPAPELIFGDLWTFDPAPETADPKLKRRYDLFIGEVVAASADTDVFRDGRWHFDESHG